MRRRRDRSRSYERNRDRCPRGNERQQDHSDWKNESSRSVKEEKTEPRDTAESYRRHDLGSGRGSFRSRGGRGGGGAAPISDYRPGEQFKVQVNQFKISPLRSQMIIHKYLVEIGHAIDESRVPKSEVKMIVLDHFLQAHGKGSLLYAYDGDRVLFALESFCLLNKVIQLGRASFNCSVVFQSSHDLMEAHLDVRPISESNLMLDVILQTVALCTQEKQGRIKFVPRAPSASQLTDLPGCPGKVLWMGHNQTVQSSRTVKITIPDGYNWGTGANPYQSGSDVYIGCQIGPSSVIGIRSQPLQEFLYRTFGYEVLRPNSRPLDRKIQRGIKNLRCETHYSPLNETNRSNKRSYKIESLDVEKKASTFEFLSDGRSVTLEQYFLEKYQIRLEFPEAPLVQVAPKSKNTYLPSELVYIAQQKIPGDYSEAQRSALADSMCMDPKDRKNYIQRKVVELFENNEMLREFGLQLDPQMIQWNAELLEGPELEYLDSRNNRHISFPTNNSQGAWNMRDKAFLEGKSLDNVCILDTTGALVGAYPLPALRGLVEDFRTQIVNVGMKGQVAVKADSVSINELLEYGEKHLQKDATCDLVIVLLKRKEILPYKAIKSTLDAICRTQCLVIDNTPGLTPRKERQRGAGHICNILAKINQKLGGVNHRIRRGWHMGTLPLLSRSKRFMIIGVNMSNPATGVFGNGKYLPSVCSLVASVDEDCTRWLHSFRVQRRGKELIEDLRAMLEDVFRRRSYYVKSSAWPDRIVFMRDGVSEGSMVEVCFQELNSIEDLFTAEGREPPEITAFVAVRNHQTRLWDPKSQDGRANLGPGTYVAESGVHIGRCPNFFLLSHAGIKGMSRPVRYFVLKDGIGMNPEIKRLMGVSLLKFWASFLYQQCYLYQRCQRAVRVPAALYYADQLAQRGRIIASPIIEKVLGIEFLSTEGSDFSSNISGRLIDDALCDRAIAEANETMKRFTENASLMFYC